MALWNPAMYLKFGSHRLRPALELLARVGADGGAAPGTVIDLGAGTGNITPFMRERWPEARIVCVDSSAEMLAEARESHAAAGVGAGVSYVQASFEDDLSGLVPGGADLLFSNAALHWAPDHAALVPRLLRQCVAPGGQLAMQIPDTRAQPSHVRMREAAERVGLGAAVAGVRVPRCEEDAGYYFDALEPLCAPGGVDAWSTEYAQRLEPTSDSPVADFTRSTGLMAFLDALGGPGSADGARFEAEYRALMRESYPPRASGATLFPFKRFFLVARSS